MRHARAAAAVRYLILTGSLAAAWLAAPAAAERMERMGPFEAHYSLVPTTLLSPEVAADYDIARGRDRALLNVTLIAADGRSVPVAVSGVVRDLLGQTRDITFREVVEGSAVYHLAEITHEDQQVLRFAIVVRTPDGVLHELAFQQKMHWSDR